MKKIFIIFALVFSLIGVVNAKGNLEDALGQLSDVTQESGIQQDDLGLTVGTIINGALTLVGIIFLGFMVYAGYLWLTARGEEDPIEKAKKIITNSIIGLIIVMSAYAITIFITSRYDSGRCPTTGVTSAEDCAKANCTAQNVPGSGGAPETIKCVPN